MLKFASRQYGRHLAVTLAVVAINMFWLLPLAACAVLWNVGGMLALIIACVPLYCSPSDFMLASLRTPSLKVKKSRFCLSVVQRSMMEPRLSGMDGV